MFEWLQKKINKKIQQIAECTVPFERGEERDPYENLIKQGAAWVYHPQFSSERISDFKMDECKYELLFTYSDDFDFEFPRPKELVIRKYVEAKLLDMYHDKSEREKIWIGLYGEVQLNVFRPWRKDKFIFHVFERQRTI